MAGYAGTPLWKKLGLKAGDRLHAIGAPAQYADLVTRLPEGAAIGGAPGRITHLFCRDVAALHERLPGAARSVPDDGMLWISWPKKASGIDTDITESDVRAAGLAARLVDVKICAVDETWSALKFVVRVRDRGRQR